MATVRNPDIHEENPSVATPQNESAVVEHSRGSRTPLPKLQLALLMLIQFSEPITALVIYPFINQFVRLTGITGGDDRKTGYYAGILESAFFFAEGATVFYWGSLSDRIGRRPVLLIAPLGLAMATFKLGYSTWFLSIMLSRCLQGAFNGNIGVSKTVIVELTDETNIGDAFAMMQLMWSVGSTVAPIIGGGLSNPSDRWPNVFGRLDIFRNYPYLLPCLASATVALFSFLVAVIGFEETNPAIVALQVSEKKNARHDPEISRVSSTDTLLEHNNSADYGTVSPRRHTSPSSSASSLDSSTITEDLNPEAPTLGSALRSKKIQFIIINYFFLTFTDMAYLVLTPLIYSTKIELGGLGLDAYHIGMITGTWGFINAFVQIGLLGKLIRKYGSRRIYQTSYASFFVCVLTYPVSTYLARRNGGISVGVCISIFVQLLFQISTYMAYGATHVGVAESSPKPILGSVNGLVQMVGCSMRTFAPAVSSSLFSLSLQKHLLGGNFVYVVLLAVILVGIMSSLSLSERKQKVTV